jgi:hypothetical protein
MFYVIDEISFGGFLFVYSNEEEKKINQCAKVDKVSSNSIIME